RGVSAWRKIVTFGPASRMRTSDAIPVLPSGTARVICARYTGGTVAPARHSVNEAVSPAADGPASREGEAGAPPTAPLRPRATPASGRARSAVTALRRPAGR